MSASAGSSPPPNGAGAVGTPAPSGAPSAAPSVAPPRSTTTSMFARLVSGESGFLKSSRLILLVVLALAALYGLHYGFFAVQRQKYLMARDLRALTAMSSQVGASLGSARRVLDEQLSSSDSAALARASPFIPVLSYVTAVERDSAPGSKPQETTLWSGPMARGCSSPQADPSLTTSWRPDLARGGSCLVRLARLKADSARSPTRQVRMSLNAGAYLESILRHPVGTLVFERTVLADTAGRILAQIGGSDVGVARLDVLWRPGSASDKRGGAAAPGWAELRQSPNIAEADLAGTSYKVFLEPCCVGSDGVLRDAQLVVAGMVSRWSFVRDSLRISLTAFTVIAALLALAVLSWPFLRLWLLGERQRVQLSDGITLGVSILLVLMLSTILLLDAYAYGKFRQQRDDDLTSLSRSMLTHFQTELGFARAQLARLVDVLEKTSDDSLNSDFLKSPSSDSILFFPAFESWSLVDRTGQQRRKWSVDGSDQPHISVRERRYFQGLLTRRGANRTVAGPVAPDWELESIRSWSTGKREAALSIEVDGLALGQDSLPVATMGLNLPSLIGVVLPPTFGFAMIDEEGKVLFHSDTSRNLAENFFVEADQNRQLRSAAFARTAASFNLTYGGIDHRAHVAPVPDRTWMLVTFRDKDPGRVLNIEMISSSLWLAILYVTALLGLGVGALLLRPTYRVPWLWPDRRQGSAYAQLSVVLPLFIAAFSVALARLSGDALLVAATALPLLVTLVVYIRLTRREPELRLLGDHLRRFAGPSGERPTRWYGDRRMLRAGVRCATVALGLVTFGLVVWKAGAPAGEMGAVLGLCLLASILALTLGGSAREPLARGTGGRRIMGPYGSVAVLYLLLIAVFPAAAYFHLAHAAHMEQMVKHSQLVVARELQDRQARIQLASARTAEGSHSTSPAVCLQSGVSRPDSSPFWCRLDLYRGFVDGGDTAFLPDTSLPLARTAIVGALLFPYQTETAVQWRGLSEPGAGDQSWTWKARNRSLSFQMRATGAHSPITLATALPPLLPESNAQVLALILIGGLLLLIVSAVARFLIRRLLLVDVTAPVLVTKDKWITTLADVNLFIVCRNCDEENVITASSRVGKVIDLQKSLLKVPHILDEVRPELRTGSSVLLTHFERSEGDPGASKAKLFLIESLVREYGCSVTVMAGRTSGGYARGLLGSLNYADAEPSQSKASLTCRSFVTVDAGRWELSPGGNRGAQAGSEAAARPSLVRELIESESRYDRNLREIWSSVPEYVGEATRHAGEPGREELLDLLAERAEAYYDAVWEDCQPEERLVLVYVAADGLANGRDRRTLRRLLVRGLIQRRPNFVVMNETFRMYLLRHVKSAERAFEARGRSTWDSVRLPAMVVLIAALGFFFMTQQDLLNLANAALAGVTAAAAGVAQVVNLVSKRRQGTTG
jgi:hypothetical protein